MKNKILEEEYREAARIWREKNPNAKSIKKNTTIKIANGKEIKLGVRIANMRAGLVKLTQEQKEFWKEYGLFDGHPTEEEYREAAMIWKKKHPNLQKIPTNEKITISNGKEINLGTRMRVIYYNQVKLTEEQKEFWKDYGLYTGNKKQEKNLIEEKTKFAQDLIAEIANRVSKKYDISFSNILYMFETLKEYELLDVGLEEDYDKKMQKIEQYCFNEFDLANSYFIVLAFKSNVLQEKTKKFLQRQELLTQNITNWHFYTEEEKQKEICSQNLTFEELEFIQRSREEMDGLIKNLTKE